MVVDAIAQGNKARWTTHKSGGPIKALAAFYKVDPSQIIVLHDELDIPFSTSRVKFVGGDN